MEYFEKEKSLGFGVWGFVLCETHTISRHFHNDEDIVTSKILLNIQ